MIAYSELTQRLLEIVPELRPAYERELQSWAGSQPGQHVVFGDLLTPYLLSLLESGRDREVLERVFGFLEVLANHPEKIVQEVVALSVVERLTDKEVSDYWDTSPGFPFD